MEQTYNVKTAPATSFQRFIAQAVEVNERNVDTSTWPIHHRWRALNTALAAGVLKLAEVEDGYKVEVVPEEKASQVEEKSSELLTSGAKGE